MCCLIRIHHSPPLGPADQSSVASVAMRRLRDLSGSQERKTRPRCTRSYLEMKMVGNGDWCASPGAFRLLTMIAVLFASCHKAACQHATPPASMLRPPCRTNAASDALIFGREVHTLRGIIPGCNDAAPSCPLGSRPTAPRHTTPPSTTPRHRIASASHPISSNPISCDPIPSTSPPPSIRFLLALSRLAPPCPVSYLTRSSNPIRSDP